MKHKLKNIANRSIPVEGTDFKPMPGEIVEVEITGRLKYMIKNKFFEDLGVIEEEALVSSDVFRNEEEAKPTEDYTPRKPKKPRKKKGRKKSKKKEVKTSEEL